MTNAFGDNENMDEMGGKKEIFLGKVFRDFVTGKNIFRKWEICVNDDSCDIFMLVKGREEGN